MADTIILEVERFHPERDTEPSYQSFEVPLRDDWMVLDALNYIKDQLDGLTGLSAGRAGWGFAAVAA